MLEPSNEEVSRRAEVMAAIFECIRANRPVKLPPFDPAAGNQVGAEPNPFNGKVGDLAYQFEGEEDLLHLIIRRADHQPLPPNEARAVAAWLFSGVPPALIWFKAGTIEQHFYLGHDDLLKYSGG
ncbi:MAG: hypothetical protein JNK63_07535 [Chthonomonas sp.]|nr:hypothetical protein [Chthonomonas sp.]